MKNDFDPDNKYTVPYYWGTVGILYDKTVVDENDLKEGWNILRNKNTAVRFICMILKGILLCGGFERPWLFNEYKK